MKTGKGSADDGITVDRLKMYCTGNACYPIFEMLSEYNLYKCVSSLEKWQKTLIPEKGDSKDLNNYRHITLLKVAYKQFTFVRVNRIGNSPD